MTRRRRGSASITLAVLAVAAAAYSLQQTMVLPALPMLADELGTTTAWATWAFTSFMIASTVATPLLGKLGDQHGKERMLLISLSLFFVGCVGAAVAWDLWSLVGFRALQGAGGAVFPLGYAIVNDELPRERVGTGLGLMSSMLAIGSALGLVISGLVLDHLSWRWLFVIGAVGVGLAAVLVHLLIPESPIRTRARLDVLGTVLLSLTLVALLLALTNATSWGWTSPAVVGLLAAAVALLAAWVVVEQRTPEPIVDLRTFSERRVVLTNLGTFFLGVPMFSTLVLVVALVQAPGDVAAPIAAAIDYGFGASPTATGLLLLSGASPGLLAGAVAGRLGRRFGPERVLFASAAMSALGIASLALWHDAMWQVAAGMALFGFNAPLSFATIATLIVHAVPAEEAGVSAGMNTVVRTIGGVIGAQLATALLQLDTIAGSEVPTDRSYTLALAFVAGAAALASLAALKLCFDRVGVRGRRQCV